MDQRPHESSNVNCDIATEESSEMGPHDGNAYNSGPRLSEETTFNFQEWGFRIERLFEVACKFYKRNESKAFHPTFDERNRMNALIMQAKYGDVDAGKAPEIGFLDLVGKRRIYEWSLFKGMSRTEAMIKFVYTLDGICPLFKAYAEAIKISSGHGGPLNDDTDQLFVCPGSTNSTPSNANLSSKESDELRSIYSSLCRQTYKQFKIYAEKQCPSDRKKQKELITLLQRQYYQQYVSQMHPELRSHLEQDSVSTNMSHSAIPSPSGSEASRSTGSRVGDDKYLNQDLDRPDAPLSQLTSTIQSLNIDLRSDTCNSIEQQSSPPIDASLKSLSPAESYESNYLQADISTDELDTSRTMLSPVNSEKPSVNNVDKSYQSNMANTNSLPDHKRIGVSKDPAPDRQPLFKEEEPVKMFQTVEMPDIGPFEPFPEPVPVKVNRSQYPNIDAINPNLPKPSPEERVKDDAPSRAMAPYSPSIKTDGMYDVEISSTQDEEHLGSDDECFRPPNSNQPEVTDPKSSEYYPELWGCDSNNDDAEEVVDNLALDTMEPVTIWTKKSVAEFKDSLADDKHGGIYEVKQATAIVIRVPTYPNGRYIYWEFATDDYDIGFGLDFVYETDTIEPLAINIYEQSDDDDDELSQADEDIRDLESGIHGNDQNGCDRSNISKKRSEKLRRLSNTMNIIPTYRRDSHEEVFAGRHKYPGRGYYLLKFDNTYSMLRSKSLYFRTCYFV